MAQEMKFKPEDLVKLTVPSPLMTVIGYNNTGEVVCNWFSTSGDFQSGAFTEEMLELVELPKQERPNPAVALMA